MIKQKAVDYFGGVGKLAEALKITPPSVSEWKEVIPEGQALRLERITGGDLTYDESHYRKVKKSA